MNPNTNYNHDLITENQVLQPIQNQNINTGYTPSLQPKKKNIKAFIIV